MAYLLFARPRLSKSPRAIFTLAAVTTMFSAVLLVLPAEPSWAQWIDPSGTPGSYTGEIPTLLNGSSKTQQRLGSLVLGDSTTTSYLCLNSPTNSDGSLKIYDPATCVASWAQAVSGNLRALRLSQVQTGKGSALSDYNITDIGYIRVQQSGNLALNQARSIIAEANDQVGLTGARGLFAISSNTGAYAGYFKGAVLSGDVQAPNNNPNGRVCVNGTLDYNPISHTGNCLNDWSDYFFNGGGIGYVNLQTTTTLTPQVGQAQTSKALLLGSLISGTPAAGTPVVAPNYTCGDGSCNNGEQYTVKTGPGYCPLDCVTVPRPFLSVDSHDSKATGTLTILGLGVVSAPLQAFVIRREGSPPTFVPQQGVRYSVGMTFGADTIVYVGSNLNVNTQYNFTDMPLQNLHTYYYAAYEGNAYPRYSAVYQYPFPVIPDIEYQLTVTLAGQVGFSSIGDSLGRINCFQACEFGQGNCGTVSCQALYTRNTLVQLFDSEDVNSQFVGYTGACTGTGCEITMDSSKGVVATFASRF